MAYEPNEEDNVRSTNQQLLAKNSGSSGVHSWVPRRQRWTASAHVMAGARCPDENDIVYVAMFGAKDSPNHKIIE